MELICRERNCLDLIVGEKYIAAIGSGVTVLERHSYSFVHRFTKMPNICGGFFVEDDILVVYTTAQRVYYLDISAKSVLWELPRPPKLGGSGDMVGCLLPDSNRSVFFGRSRKDYFKFVKVIVDNSTKEVVVEDFPDAYRVVERISTSPDFGNILLSTQAVDNENKGNSLFRLIRVNSDGSTEMLHSWVEKYCPAYFNGKHLIVSAQSGGKWKSLVYVFSSAEDYTGIENMKPFEFPLPLFTTGFSSDRNYLPFVFWMDESTSLMTAGNTSEWTGVYSLKSQTLISEYDLKWVWYAEIVDGKLLMCTDKGLVAVDFKYPE